jgi:anaerobic magnesium-protoporphyrin IX monomethyl ester cyclase
MQVTLITPPSTFLLDERMFPNLGILKVASSLIQAGWNVNHLDLSGYRNYGEIVASYAKTAGIVYGITATTPQLPAAVEITAAIRSARASARIILGGSHATLVYAAKRRDEKYGRIGRAHRAAERLENIFDCIVAGDGERAIFHAYDCTEKVVDADGFRDEKGKRSLLYLTPNELEMSSFPARHLIDLDSYNFSIDGVRASSIIAQLGCPFECGFCGGRNSPSLRHIRTRSSSAVVDEMLYMYHRFGIRGFMFYDDEQNLVHDEFMDLLERMIRVQQNIGVQWRLRGNIKSQLFTEAQAEAMYRAGYRKILVGFESGSPRILANIRKRATQEDNTRCMAIARKYKLHVKALMSLGHPGESRSTIEETRDWLREVKPNEADFTIITPYPGSPYYDDALPCGERKYVYSTRTDKLYQEEVDYITECDYYKGDPNALVLSHVWTDYLSAKELVEERQYLEADIRHVLGIPYHRRADPVDASYGHSMGQTPVLPSRMFRAV